MVVCTPPGADQQGQWCKKRFWLKKNVCPWLSCLVSFLSQTDVDPDYEGLAPPPLILLFLFSLFLSSSLLWTSSCYSPLPSSSQATPPMVDLVSAGQIVLLNIGHPQRNWRQLLRSHCLRVRESTTTETILSVRPQMTTQKNKLILCLFMLTVSKSIS